MVYLFERILLTTCILQKWVPSREFFIIVIIISFFCVVRSLYRRHPFRRVSKSLKDKYFNLKPLLFSLYGVNEWDRYVASFLKSQDLIAEGPFTLPLTSKDRQACYIIFWKCLTSGESSQNKEQYQLPQRSKCLLSYGTPVKKCERKCYWII